MISILRFFIKIVERNSMVYKNGRKELFHYLVF